MSKEVDALMLDLGYESKGESGKDTYTWNIWGGWRYREDGVPSNVSERGESTSACRALTEEVRFGQRWVSKSRSASFYRVAVSLMLPITLARFYTATLYDGLGD